MTQTSTVKGKGFFKLVLCCMGWMFQGASCKAGEAELGNLKTMLESRGN